MKTLFLQVYLILCYEQRNAPPQALYANVDIIFFQVNGKCLKGLFHEAVVRSLKNLPVRVQLVCARKATGPSPIRGTIVDNVDTGRSEQAFASRVSLEEETKNTAVWRKRRVCLFYKEKHPASGYEKKL